MYWYWLFICCGVTLHAYDACLLCLWSTCHESARGGFPLPQSAFDTCHKADAHWPHWLLGGEFTVPDNRQRDWPLTWQAKLRIVHAPGMSGTFSPPPLVGDTDMHHGTGVTHVRRFMPGSLTSNFLWSSRRGKLSRCMRNPQLCVSVKRPISRIN